MTTADLDAFLLEDGYVLTLDDDDTRGPLSIAIEAGVVTAIGPRRDLRRRFAGAHRIACRGRIVMPGLVNAHLHPDLHVLKGTLEERGLHDWSGAGFYNDAVTFLGSEAGSEMLRDSVRAAVAECALNGTTTIGTYGVTTGSEHACDDALAGMGVHGTITVRDVAFPPFSAPSGRAHFYRLHAEETLYEPELAAASAAHARGARIVMHAAETQHRVDIARRRFGMSTIRLLAHHRLLSPRMLLSHAVHVDDDEVALIAQAGAAVVVSPAAEMKLGDGVPPVPALLARGATVAIGTDAAVCNNASDMFLEMRLLGLSQKLRWGPDALPAEQILRLATRHGAAALGDPAGGCIAEGRAADIILVDATGPRLQPLVLDGPGTNVAANLVYAATGSDVTDVMVGGRWIVRRRRLRVADAPRLWRRLARHATHLDNHLRM
ncbi:MAG TPA: amidohydrolase family protein [Longimicrobiales bacterium]|nr:amidohydrolase family protein [Longimicrobiales bacterium]